MKALARERVGRAWAVPFRRALGVFIPRSPRLQRADRTLWVWLARTRLTVPAFIAKARIKVQIDIGKGPDGQPRTHGPAPGNRCSIRALTSGGSTSPGMTPGWSD